MLVGNGRLLVCPQCQSVVHNLQNTALFQLLRDERVATALEAIAREYKRATEIHAPFHSAHEAWAVMHEETDELWDEVRKRKSERDKDATYREAVQATTMGLRFLVDICLGRSKEAHEHD